MIYICGLKGRKGYQKLHKVLDFDITKKEDKGGYEEFSKTVDAKYKTFNEEMKNKMTRTNFHSSNKKNEKNKRKEYTSNLSLNKIIKNAPKIHPIGKLKKKKNKKNF